MRIVAMTVAALALLHLTGCRGDSGKGLIGEEGKVVLRVEGMNCESCPEQIKSLLSRIPWIKKDTVFADPSAATVEFTVTDRRKFKMSEIHRALRGKPYRVSGDPIQGP